MAEGEKAEGRDVLTATAIRIPGPFHAAGHYLGAQILDLLAHSPSGMKFAGVHARLTTIPGSTPRQDKALGQLVTGLTAWRLVDTYPLHWKRNRTLLLSAHGARLRSDASITLGNAERLGDNLLSARICLVLGDRRRLAILGALRDSRAPASREASPLSLNQLAAVFQDPESWIRARTSGGGDPAIWTEPAATLSTSSINGTKHALEVLGSIGWVATMRGSGYVLAPELQSDLGFIESWMPLDSIQSRIMHDLTGPSPHALLQVLRKAGDQWIAALAAAGGLGSLAAGTHLRRLRTDQVVTGTRNGKYFDHQFAEPGAALDALETVGRLLPIARDLVGATRSVAGLCAVLSDPFRRHIAWTVGAAGEGGVVALEIVAAEGVGLGTALEHLHRLELVGAITCIRRGSSLIFRANAGLADLIAGAMIAFSEATGLPPDVYVSPSELLMRDGHGRPKHVDLTQLIENHRRTRIGPDDGMQIL